ncbi:MAG: hypothetical protein AUJ07_10415 [Crenarchaeota archaeon 13_1_40CM_3_53_5]|nr:MAG: hypothetical protein AUJ07_10415 [Crenarchaeota archaeon 13_1_40CM_3_53_5]
MRSSASSLSDYVRRYPGAPLVVEFEVLLLWAALLLVQGNSVSASYVGSYSLLSLALGITFQVFKEISESTRRGFWNGRKL